MRFMLKQRAFSIGDKFVIRDENERDVYQVAGKVLTIGDKLSFQDMTGHELFFIKQRLLTLAPKYEIWQGGRLFATVRKKLFTFFGSRYFVQVHGEEDMEIEGNMFGYEYKFTRGGRLVAHVSEHFFSWTDTYGVDVVDGEDNALVLACVIVIDMVSDRQSRSGGSVSFGD